LDLKKIKQKYSEPEQEIRMIITPFYKHLISEHRDLHDYLKTQDILHQNLIQENEDLLGKIQDYKKHNEESEQSYNEIASNLDYIQNLKKNFSDELEEDSNNTYSLFCEKITEYWTKLSKIKDKEIIVKNDQLYVYSTSRKKASKSAKITSLSHKQKRLSRSQIELLRYSIQLALIMGIYSKFQVLPIKAIIIDDPNSKYVPELIDLLDSEFIQKWGFQILILTNINVVYPWDIKKFDPYIGNLDIFTTNHQIEKDKWKAENE